MPNPSVTPIPLMPGRWRPLGMDEAGLFRQRVSDRLAVRGGAASHQPPLVGTVPSDDALLALLAAGDASAP